ncbi:MAG: acyltransferase [Anaerovoracaceae bacterium]|jgi:acetyltransferase-like isoleucine patch superfamily enzyme
MNTFYSEEELKQLGIKKYGKNVKIGRHAILYNPEQLEIGNNVRIDDFSIISGNVIIHDYNHVSQFAGLYGGTAGIELMDFVGVSSKVSIYSTTVDYSKGEKLTNPTIPEEFAATSIDKKVTIGKHVLVGSGSVVLPGANIGEGSTVGCMSFCNKELGEWGVYVGIPARRLKDRPRDLLKQEKLLREKLG